MAIPPEPLLRAALRWMERLTDSGHARLRSLFTTHAEFSDLTPTQYSAAYSWLQEVGLVDSEGVIVQRSITSGLPRVAVFEAALSNNNTVWLPDADLLVRHPDDLPQDALEAGLALGLDPVDAFAATRLVWGKVDSAERERVGLAGELALVQLLERELHAEVRHVAAASDGYGFDIAISAPNLVVHLEVKTTTKRSRLAVYLSRHEYETMQRDENWVLAAIRLNLDLTLAAVATVQRDWLQATVPGDRSARGRWESARLDIPPNAMSAGLGILNEVMRQPKGGLLGGDTAWPG